MQKFKFKRPFALIVALMLLTTLNACTSTHRQVGDPLTTSTNGNTLFDKPTELKIIIPTHPSWPYDENWLSWKYIREATGATIKITTVPTTEVERKFILMMADKSSIPDLSCLVGKKHADSYGPSGALIAIDDHLDEMPNYIKFWNSIPTEKREMLLVQRRSYDGKTYYPQNYGTGDRQGVRAWLYRKDIFEKNKIKTPETMEEVYQVAKQLKKLYPESYPLCMRDGLRNIGIIGSEWKPNFTYGLYYDYDNKKWCYGAIEPTMREIVEFMRKMCLEGLVPPDYLTINAKTWEELMSTDRGFILPDFVVRVDNFNTPNRKNNPNYTIAAMKPPRANTSTGQSLMNKFNVDTKGYMILNTGSKERIKNSIKFIDWLYSDEAAQLLGWGKEGETYEVKNGNKQFIRPENGDIEGKYGLLNYGSYLRVDPDAALHSATDEQLKSVLLGVQYTEKYYNPSLWVAFSDEDIKKRDSLGDAITNYTEEMLSKFLYNQEPMSNWDKFVNELNSFGINDYLALYEKNYNNTVKNK